MRISLLLKREPFGLILEKTLEKFLTVKHGVIHQVHWHSGWNRKSLIFGSETWLCNSNLNAIFLPRAKKAILLPVIQEFSRSTTAWRTPLQRLYVALATAPVISSLFANAMIEISPQIADASQVLILGGNHHIRFLDYRNNRCFVIAKVGFNLAFIANEIRVRRKNPDVPAPAILEVADDFSWYSEALIQGTPANRMRKGKQVDSNIGRLMKSFFTFLKETAVDAFVNEYTHTLTDRIDHHIDQDGLLGYQLKEQLRRLVRALEQIISETGEGIIVISQTHGDFQPANILIQGEHSWLIDWEYTAQRQIGYDALVYVLGSRFPKGLAERLNALLHARESSARHTLKDWPGLAWGETQERRRVLALFLLEELELKLMEMASPVFTRVPPSFEAFRQELEKCVEVLCGKECRRWNFAHRLRDKTDLVGSLG